MGTARHAAVSSVALSLEDKTKEEADLEHLVPHKHEQSFCKSNAMAVSLPR